MDQRGVELLRGQKMGFPPTPKCPPIGGGVVVGCGQYIEVTKPRSDTWPRGCSIKLTVKVGADKWTRQPIYLVTVRLCSYALFKDSGKKTKKMWIRASGDVIERRWGVCWRWIYTQFFVCISVLSAKRHCNLQYMNCGGICPTWFIIPETTQSGDCVCVQMKKCFYIMYPKSNKH